MKLVLRLAFVGLILLAVGWKFLARAPASTPNDPRRAIQAVLSSKISGPINQARGTDGMIVWSVPVVGCGEPLLVAPTTVSLSGVTELLEFAPPKNRRLFAYLDWKALKPDRGAIQWRRYRERLLQAAGLSTYSSTNIRLALFVSEPPSCNISATTPWRRFWLAN